MLTINANQQRILNATGKTITWKFIVTDINSTVYNWSTKVVDEYIFKIIDFKGLTFRRAGSESGIHSPNTLDFSILNEDDVLDPYDFINGKVQVYLEMTDDTGTETIASWSFDIKNASSVFGKKIIINAVDFVQKYLDGEYPKKPLVKDLFPANISSDSRKGCAPIVFGTSYIPLENIYSDDNYYLLGNATGTYTLSQVKTPTNANTNPSRWNYSGTPNNTTTFNMPQSTKTDPIYSTNWRVFRPLIIDANNDDTYDESAVWISGTSNILPLPTKFTHSDTVNTTNPGDVISYVLQDLGIDSSEINATSFSLATATFASWGLEFNGAFWYKKTRTNALSDLLNMCHSTINITDKINLNVLSKSSVATLTSSNILKNSYKRNSRVNQTSNDSAYVSYQETDETQDHFIKILVPAKASIDNVSSKNIVFEMIQNSVHAQTLGILYYQRIFLKKDTISCNVKTSGIVLQPDDIVTINDSLYGLSFDAVIDSITINKEGFVSLKLFTTSDTLDDWDDITVSSISATNTNISNAFYNVTCGPVGNSSSGLFPNMLPGKLTVGYTGDNILIDPDIPGIIVSESGNENLKIGKLGADDYGMQAKSAIGTLLFKIGSEEAKLSNFNIQENRLWSGTTATYLELDTTTPQVKVVSGSSYISMSPDELLGYTDGLGSVFRLFTTTGQPPEFSSGIIKECEYQIYTSGVIKTSASPATDGGLIINNIKTIGYDNTGLKTYEVIYDGADEGDFYFGDYDNSNSGIKYDHSAEQLYIRGDVEIDGNFYVGNATVSYIDWDGNDLEIRMSADATFTLFGNFTVESGGNITIKDAGDLIFETITGVDNSYITWERNGDDYHLGASQDYDLIGIWSDTNGLGSFLIGQNVNNTQNNFQLIGMYADSVVLKADNSFNIDVGYAATYPRIEIDSNILTTYANYVLGAYFDGNKRGYQRFFAQTGTITGEFSTQWNPSTIRNCKLLHTSTSTYADSKIEALYGSYETSLQLNSTDSQEFTLLAQRSSSGIRHYYEGKSNSSTAWSYQRSYYTSTKYTNTYNGASSGGVYLYLETYYDSSADKYTKTNYSSESSNCFALTTANYSSSIYSESKNYANSSNSNIKHITYYNGSNLYGMLELTTTSAAGNGLFQAKYDINKNSYCRVYASSTLQYTIIKSQNTSSNTANVKTEITSDWSLASLHCLNTGGGTYQAGLEVQASDTYTTRQIIPVGGDDVVGFGNSGNAWHTGYFHNLYSNAHTTSFDDFDDMALIKSRKELLDDARNIIKCPKTNAPFLDIGNLPDVFTNIEELAKSYSILSGQEVTTDQLREVINGDVDKTIHGLTREQAVKHLFNNNQKMQDLSLGALKQIDNKVIENQKLIASLQNQINKLKETI